MNLKQDGMLVIEYEQKFTELLEFTPFVVADDADRCKKFQDGLHVSIRDGLTTLDNDGFNKWVNMVIEAEKNLKEMKDKKEKFKKRKGQSSSEDMRLKKSYSKNGTNGFRPSRFEGGSKRRPFVSDSYRPPTRSQYQPRFFSWEVRKTSDLNLSSVSLLWEESPW